MSSIPESQAAPMHADNTNYDLLYNPRLLVPDYEEISARCRRDSEKARATLDCYLDVPYGPTPGEKLDLFRSQGPSRGLLMFIHGGYWRAQDKANFSFIAPAITAAGITLAVPNYALCPAVEVEDIVMQMVQACAWLYRNGSHFGAAANRLYVAGHSAGGHLTSMMLTTLWPAYAPDLPERTVRGGLSISGIYDLTEMVKVPSVNCDVCLTTETARKLSPAFLPPATDAPLYTAVGDRENEGFHIQNRIIAKNWARVHRADIACPGDNHFTVLDRLADPGSALFAALLQMMGIAPEARREDKPGS
jgi:arylformamidase